MRSTVIIERRHAKDGVVAHYVISASGKFGGGYSGRHLDADLDRVAAVAAGEMIRYAQTNDEGGDLVAPADVLALVPEHLRSVPAQSRKVMSATEAGL